MIVFSSFFTLQIKVNIISRELWTGSERRVRKHMNHCFVQNSAVTYWIYKDGGCWLVQKRANREITKQAPQICYC